jgi:hypothetical protein
VLRKARCPVANLPVGSMLGSSENDYLSPRMISYPTDQPRQWARLRVKVVFEFRPASVSTLSRFERLSILTVITPVLTVLRDSL